MYPENAFGVSVTKPTKIYRRRKCRDCYRQMKMALIERHYEWINAYKGAKGCSRCGINNPVVLDFHHKDDKNRNFGISAVRREVGFKKLQEEIEKCEVICSNCHRLEHHEMKRNKKDGA